MTAPNPGFRLCMLHALGAAHGRPVICVLSRAQKANLVVVPVRATPRPGELVRAAPKHKNIHDFLRHDGYFRTQLRTKQGAPKAASSSPETGFLGRLLSCWTRLQSARHIPIGRRTDTLGSEV